MVHEAVIGERVTARQIFLLSPASCHGRRAQILMSDRAEFDLARRLRSKEGASLGEVFAFLSGLYFRGKLTYANHFASPPDGVGGVWIITPGAGLLPPDQPVIQQSLRQFASVTIDITDQRYVQPLLVHSQRLKHEIGNDTDVILLGSIASKKYTGILCQVFGERLLFPEEFVGRGDMSRGGLMLRCVDDDRELRYIQAQGAVRTGTRPPRLIPRVVSKAEARHVEP